jgi:acyl carrier protein
MATTYPQILDEVLELMTSLAGDWEYSGEIAAHTYLLGDLGFESLDLVVLGTTLQERYGRLPFSELLADLGQRQVKDVTVGELVDFVARHSTRLAV